VISPTAQASVRLAALTLVSAIVPQLRFLGTVTCCHDVPFQCSASGLPLMALIRPTAQASEPLSALTPYRVAFCPAGGTGTTVHPLAAAGPAASTTANAATAPAPNPDLT
jgi:hypothetical protein